MKKIAYDQMYENELTHAWYLGTRELMTKKLKSYVEKNSKILDLGCGTGGTIKFLSRKGFRNIFGIDSSQYAINLCKKRGIKNIKKASVNKLPFKDSSFDAVYCLDVLYHNGVNLTEATSEVARVLKKDGVFYSQEPAYTWLKSKHDLAIETKTRFTKKSLLKGFSKSGLRNLKLSYFNLLFFMPIALVRIKDKVLKPSSEDSDVSELPYLLNKIMLLALRTEAIVFKFIDLPFGLSLISIWRK